MKNQRHKTTLKNRVNNRNESLMVMHAIDTQNKKAKRRAKI